ncbi:MAG: hypothetical protein EA380_00755 [Phycisphaeraceae bacterium]|nr:MAG: hypothetical protein EA380_00755 [Phycisphaeraceae bacterium]
MFLEVDMADSGPGARNYREVTLLAIGFAVIVGIVMNAAITYSGLKIGFTISGSAIAAVLGFGFLRGLVRKGTIVEVNIAQTIASAVNTTNSGVIFTVPVLFLLGFAISWHDRDFWLITAACMAGATLGAAFIIPLRKQMIDIERLRFPSATGVATILKSPGAGPAKAVVLLVGMAISALIYAPSGLPGIRSEIDSGFMERSEQRTVLELVRSQETDADSFDRLDTLVFNERVSRNDAQRTRDIDGWIQAEAAPEPLVQRGALLKERRSLRDQMRELEAEIQRMGKEDPARSERRDELQGLREQILPLDDRLHSDESQDALKTVLPGDEPTERTALYPDSLALALYQISADLDGMTWADLRHRDYGWATKPLWGYHDLQWRLPPQYDADGNLSRVVDRNGNGRPDLWLTDSTIDIGRLIVGFPAEIPLIFAIAPFALGAGYITGKAGLMVLAGGLLAYFVLMPLAFNGGLFAETVQAWDAAETGRAMFTRPMGIGMLVGGALMGLLFSLPAIKEALRSVAASTATRASKDELGIGVLLLAAAIAVGLLFAGADLVGSEPLNKGGTCPVTEQFVDTVVEPVEYRGYKILFASDEAREVWLDEWTDEERSGYLAENNARPGLLSALNPHVRAALIAIFGAIWIWFTGIIIAQCTGMTDWSPISGLALVTVVLVMLLAGTGQVLGAVLIGAAMCTAITLAADMMGDLKTGYLVGATPKRQQKAELFLAWLGPIVCMLTLVLIVQANMSKYGVPLGEGTDTPAPQAQALEAVITGVQGGDMPYALYAFGALLGGLLGLGSFPGLGVLVGLSMYLPFFYIATYGLGCLINIAVSAVKGKRFAEDWGVPFAAGILVGEPILAMIVNMFEVIRSSL